MRPRLALVPGEPGGVGPELCVRLAQGEQAGELLAIADPDTLLAAASALGLPLRLRAPGEAAGAGELAVLARRQPAPVRFGHADPANAGFVIECLLEAGRGCLDGGFDGVVTGPVHKASINAGGIAYSGTTELLAAQAGAEVVMMLASPTLRVALATTHLPLRAVPDAITRGSLERCLRILHAALRGEFGIATPRIAVLGLNPHAGEDGHARPRRDRGDHPGAAMRCAPKACSCRGRCPPTPPSCRRRCAAAMRCWRCTTTRACRCSSTRASSRR